MPKASRRCSAGKGRQLTCRLPAGRQGGGRKKSFNTKIKESNNLRCDRCPSDHFEGFERVDPDRSILESFTLSMDNIELYFKNGSTAFIRAKNPEGRMEIARISRLLDDAFDKSYTQILEIDF